MPSISISEATEKIQTELRANPAYRSAWVSSIESALRDTLRKDATIHEVAEAILDRISGA